MKKVFLLLSIFYSVLVFSQSTIDRDLLNPNSKKRSYEIEVIKGNTLSIDFNLIQIVRDNRDDINDTYYYINSYSRIKIYSKQYLITNGLSDANQDEYFIEVDSF